MKVEVRSKEKIRPSSPTPETLKNYRLSLVDQLALNVKFPMVFFYDSPSASPTHTTHDIIDGLKRSLSQTLSLMYPMAGRFNNNRLMIECNDKGVDFLEAEVAENMSCFVENPKQREIFKELIPCNQFTGTYDPNPDKKVLVIQVNRFICGGLAIGMIFSHAIADGSSMGTFLNTWAAINRGSTTVPEVNKDGSPYIFDCSQIFPPLRNTIALDLIGNVASKAAPAREKYTIRRFVFPASSLARLRNQLRHKKNDDPSSLGLPTRVEAVTALVWTAVINAVQKRQNGGAKVHVMSTIINLRNKMVPPLPPNCLGNITFGTTVQWEATDGAAADCHSLVERIHNSIQAVNGDLAMKKYGEGGYIQATLAKMDKIVEEAQNKDLYCFYTSSSCGIRFYEADFGWGKPRWVVNLQLLRDAVFFMDTKDGDGGIEAWMGLPEDVMNSLMQNQLFLEYVSCGFPNSKL